jgi:hypothetical protein
MKIFSPLRHLNIQQNFHKYLGTVVISGIV